MFNYYQHRASPDHEASDVGYEEFGHLVFSFLVGGYSMFVAIIYSPQQLETLKPTHAPFV